MIIAMGVPGAGKTTVLKAALTNNKIYTLVNYGDLMLEIEKKEFGIKDVHPETGEIVVVVDDS